ncbi:MAG: hypothetical protein AB7G93_00050 [Bdellovibrionales bacterium]
MTLAEALSLGWQDLGWQNIDTAPRHGGTVPDEILSYAQIRFYYLRCESDLLEKYLQSDFLTPRIRALGNLRLEIRRHAVNKEKLISQVDARLAEFSESLLWQGEVHMVSAMAFEVCGDDLQALSHYQMSQVKFNAAGETRKALFAEINQLAALSRVRPKAHRIYEYQRLRFKALNAQVHSVAATAGVNLSREYQRLGAKNLALRAVNEAIDILIQHDFGTYQYWLALAQRCHVLLELNENGLARIDFEEIAISQLPEAQSIAAHLREAHRAFRDLLPSAEPTVPFAWPATWAERKRRHEILRLRSRRNLSELEESVVTALSEKPRRLSELAVLIYGDKLALEHTEDRIKKVLNRLRAKYRGLVVHKGGLYALAD